MHSAAAGRVALVTGASGGIGAAVAAGLAGAGLAVGLVGRDADRLAAAERAVAAAGAGVPAASADVRVRAVRADVTDPAQVSAAVGAVEGDLGPVDLLVNAAGRIESTEVPVWAAEPREWWAVVEANLLGPFLLVQAVVPGMVARGGGRVVDVNSGFGARDRPVYSGYAASKAALLRLGGALAAAGAAHGVRAFEIAPGLVRTAMTEGMPMWADAPAGRWTPVQRVVDLVVAVAQGRLDALSGRYLRADVDTADSLLAAAERITAGDGRTLRVLPWGGPDPLA